VVVNAGGPWVDRVLKGLPARVPRLMGGTKGSHVVVSPFPGAPSSAFYIEAASDGRPMFVIPWNGLYLIGTTDIRYSGDPGEARASREEVAYLLAETNRVFPSADLSIGSVHYTYCGVRPLPWEEGPEGSITRRHIIREHDDLARGLISIIGGKLTTYRHLAEEVVDRLPRLLDRELPDCPTDDEPLPGGDGLDEARARLAESSLIGPGTADHLLAVYGSRALDVVALAAEEPGLADVVCERSGAIAAEVIYSLEHEQARTLDDLMQRRMMIGLGPKLGLDALDAVSRVAARHLGWNEEQQEAEEAGFRRRLERFRVPGADS
jgi:glycerol-3-phosphate dehydrogenase